MPETARRDRPRSRRPRDDRGDPGRVPRPRLRLRPLARDRDVPRAPARPAAAPRGRGGRRQDGAREGPRGEPRGAADPAPVLRGPRRQRRGLRVELPAPDARDPAARGARRGDERERPRHLRPGVPDPPAAPPGARGRRHGRAAGPAHRRDRPGRRGVRGVPARDPLGLPGHRAGDRHDQGRAAAARDPHLEPDPRGPRRAEAPLPLPLDRLPVGPEGVRDRLGPRAGGAGTARPRGRRLRPPPPRGRPDEGPRDRRDARLGGGAAVARRARAGPGARRRDARRRPQVRGGHPPDPGRDVARATSSEAGASA